MKERKDGAGSAENKKLSFLFSGSTCPWQSHFMPRKKAVPASKTLSKRESQIMDLLYRRGPSTVARVTENFPEPLTRNAVRTFLGILENKGQVTRTKQGREFIYAPATEQAVAAKTALSKVLDIFFQGSLSEAVATRFSGQAKPIGEDELRRLEELIAEARKKSQ